MAARTFVGSNLVGLVAAAALVVGGGVVAAADLTDASPEPVVPATGEPSAEPSLDPSAQPSAEPSAGPGEGSAGLPGSDRGSAQPSGSDEDGDRGVGPDAGGPAAFGLCNAWGRGGLGETSTARRSLEAAAGGADAVEAYCEGVVADKRAGRGQGRPDHAGGPGVRTAEPPGRAAEDDAGAGMPGARGHGRPDHAGGPGVRSAEPPGRATKGEPGAAVKRERKAGAEPGSSPAPAPEE